MLDDIKADKIRRDAEEAAKLAEEDAALLAVFGNYSALIQEFCQESGWTLVGPTFSGPASALYRRELRASIGPIGETRSSRRVSLSLWRNPYGAFWQSKPILEHRASYAYHWDQFGHALMSQVTWSGIAIDKLRTALVTSYKAVINAPPNDTYSDY